jgi:hypothetical protein
MLANSTIYFRVSEMKTLNDLRRTRTGWKDQVRNGTEKRVWKQWAQTQEKHLRKERDREGFVIR